jgi:hypothetical protein
VTNAEGTTWKSVNRKAEGCGLDLRLAVLEAQLVAQKNVSSILVVTTAFATNADGTTSSVKRISGFESRRLHKFCGAVAQLVEQTCFIPLVVAKFRSVFSLNNRLAAWPPDVRQVYDLPKVLALDFGATPRTVGAQPQMKTVACRKATGLPHIRRQSRKIRKAANAEGTTSYADGRKPLQVQILPASKEAVVEIADTSENVSSIPCRRHFPVAERRLNLAQLFKAGLADKMMPS